MLRREQQSTIDSYLKLGQPLSPLGESMRLLKNRATGTTATGNNFQQPPKQDASTEKQIDSLMTP